MTTMPMTTSEYPGVHVEIGVLARVAQLGVGKRRLAEGIGDAAALGAYRHLVRRCASCVAGAGMPVHVFLDPVIGDQAVWDVAEPTYWLQAAGDLGDRIRAAAKQVLARSASATQAASPGAQEGEQPSGALILGTDCPTLTPELLREAAAALVTHDAVLGPTLDGGYYLIGLRRWDDRLVEQIAWSTEAVAEQTRAALRELGWSRHELPALRDIDEADDWRAYRAGV